MAEKAKSAKAVVKEPVQAITAEQKQRWIERRLQNLAKKEGARAEYLASRVITVNEGRVN